MSQEPSTHAAPEQEYQEPPDEVVFDAYCDFNMTIRVQPPDDPDEWEDWKPEDVANEVAQEVMAGLETAETPGGAEIEISNTGFSLERE